MRPAITRSACSVASRASRASAATARSRTSSSDRRTCSCSTFSVRSRLVMPLWMCSCPASAENSSIRAFTSCRVTASRRRDRVEVDVVDDLLVGLDHAVGHLDAEVALGDQHGQPQPALQHDLVLRRPDAGQLRARRSARRARRGSRSRADSPHPSMARSDRSRSGTHQRATRRRSPAAAAAMSVRWCEPASGSGRPPRTPPAGRRDGRAGAHHRQHPAAGDHHVAVRVDRRARVQHVRAVDLARHVEPVRPRRRRRGAAGVALRGDHHRDRGVRRTTPAAPTSASRPVAAACSSAGRAACAAGPARPGSPGRRTAR